MKKGEIGLTILHMLSGSYAGRGEQGIKLWQFDTVAGDLKEIAAASGVERPSFLAVHPERNMFASSSEDFGGELAAFEVDLEEGRIEERGRSKGNGDHPTHVSIDRSGNWLLCVNYSAGSVNVFRLEADNTIGEMTDSIQHEGSGPNAERQDAAHPHSVIQFPDSNLFAVSDLGTDTIYCYELDAENGKLRLQQALEADKGSGPRHLAFHPALPIFYSLEELNSSVTAYSFNEERIEKGQQLSLLPEAFEGDNTAAEVAVSEDGKYLYASNRGDDSIVSFEIDGNGNLHSPEFTSSGGKGPRHFALVPGGGWLIAANEKSDSLAVLKLEDGRPLAMAQKIKTTSPVCVKFIQ
ncbi:lactonase family protein [Planococcus sp. CAU13]|uniref:lactonase family protein n=1 Tax=Planococcus sp. CAU13 TaxID=1541197 RepID=UPI0005300974|nr:lactonase family protein [Planococcus sp. CAU13]